MRGPPISGPMPGTMPGTLPGHMSAMAPLTSELPMSALPELPQRAARYFLEPWIGAGTVFILTTVIVSITSRFIPEVRNPVERYVVLPLLWLAGFLAIVSTSWIILAGAGEVKRTPATCYPVPSEVIEQLRHHDPQGRMPNVSGPGGSSYCTRCFVWRPEKTHHCSICQRCYTGFDHHCAFYGRCIARGNMICFYLVIAAALFGIPITLFTLWQHYTSHPLQLLPAPPLVQA